jgi:alanine racemase
LDSEVLLCLSPENLRNSLARYNIGLDMPSAPYRSWVEVSRTQIASNYQAVRQLVGPDVAVMPVVKADAYRHGAVEVSKVLVAEGAEALAVSNVEEGVILRDAGIVQPILVMADFLPSERPELVHYSLTPVIHSLEDIAAWDRLAALQGKPLPYHLKIDSGMGRLGVWALPAEIAGAIAASKAAQLEGLMTHFASSADYSSDQTDHQASVFRAMIAHLAEVGIRPRFVHLSSTIPIAYRRTAAWGNLVRPGHAIYGYVSPTRGEHAPQSGLDVHPALTWKAAVLAVKTVPTGAPIGYGAMYRAPRAMRIAVLAAGYADGIPHRLGNRGYVIAQGKLVPIIGAVSMDLTTIDATDCEGLAVGDSVMLLGREGDVSIDAQQMARTAGTISYSVLCGISARVRRVYV